MASAQQLGGAQLVSSNSAGEPGSGHSREPRLAPNGNLLVFDSASTNLDGRKTDPNTRDVFLQSLNSAGTYRVALLVQRKTRGGADDGAPLRGAESPSLSQLASDGVSYAVSFESFSDDLLSEISNRPGPSTDTRQVYLRIMPSGEQILVSRAFGSDREKGDSTSGMASVALVSESPLKYRVAFLSTAGNLTSPGTGPPTNRIYPQPFVATISKSSSGSWGVEILRLAAVNDGAFRDVSISGDGLTVIYSTNSTQLGASPSRFDTFVQDSTGRSPPRLVSPYARANDLETTGGSLSYSGDVRLFRVTQTRRGIREYDLYWNRSDTAEAAPLQVNTDASGLPSSSGVSSSSLAQNGDYVVFSSSARDLTSLPDPTALTTSQTYLKSLSSGLIWLTSQRSSLGSGFLFGEGGDSDVPTVGGSGFTARKFFTAFKSSARNLSDIPTDQEQIYRVAVELPPPPLTDQAPIDSPPDILVKKRRAIITLQEFGLPTSGPSAAATTNKVRYEVTVKNNTTRKRISQVTTRNRATVRNLSPGRYTVRYRVAGPGPSGGTIRSQYSPKAPMTIQ